MTGTPLEIAEATAGLTAVPSWARTTTTLAPCEMRFSMFDACVSADDAAPGLDCSLEGWLVPLRPALLLVVVPGDADDAVAGGHRRGTARRGAGARTAAARGDGDGSCSEERHQLAVDHCCLSSLHAT